MTTIEQYNYHFAESQNLDLSQELRNVHRDAANKIRAGMEKKKLDDTKSVRMAALEKAKQDVINLFPNN